MNDSNIKKLARLININIKEGHMSYDIQNPLYQSFYFEIFFDDLKSGTPTPYESFREKLLENIDIGEQNAEEAVESFMAVWNAWVVLYSQLKQRKMIAEH